MLHDRKKLGLRDPSTTSSDCFRSSERITAPLVALITSQDENEKVDIDSVRTVKNDVKRENRRRQDSQSETINAQLTPELKRCVDLSQEKGSSSWLSVLPLEEHGFYLHKGEFRDALGLRYGWKLNNTPQTCNCGAQFTVNHAMICHMGGFPTIRHNEIRDITASHLTEVRNNVAIEPALQPLSGENMAGRSANTDDGARVDIRARGFWNASQDAFFDVRVFYPNASSNRSTNPLSVYRKHEQAKKREYGQRVRDVERGVFTPLVLSSTGGMGKEATTFFKRLADMIAKKRKQHYSIVIGWLRCRISFASLRSAIMCIRGSRSSYHQPIHDSHITLATSEARIPRA